VRSNVYRDQYRQRCASSRKYKSARITFIPGRA
jgi:hypothetical protein